MASDLPLLLGGSGQVRGSVKNLGLALRDLSYELSAEMKAENFFSGAPFRCVHVVVRYDREAEPAAQLGRINRFGEIEATVQMSLEELRSARGDLNLLKSRITPYIRLAVDAVAKKYGLNAMPSNKSLERTRDG
jgi:hypothetical protein